MEFIIPLVLFPDLASLREKIEASGLRGSPLAPKSPIRPSESFRTQRELALSLSKGISKRPHAGFESRAIESESSRPRYPNLII